MSIREEQCNKVCRILDDVLANRPTERDSLIVAVRKAFEALELFGNSEPLPSAQPERLTDDDFETIRIHLNALKEKLCNQRRWEEAEEYQRIIDRFMAFASAQPERKKGEWTNENGADGWNRCSVCGELAIDLFDYCPNCGADMRGEQDERTD